MIQECKTNIGTAVALQCDEPRCAQEIAIERELRDDCNHELFLAGWRIYRGKHLCPNHAARVERKLLRHSERQRGVRLIEEKERADGNFASCERIKSKYSECFNREKALHAALEAVEWIYDGELGEDYCPACGAMKRTKRHKPDCTTGVALDRPECRREQPHG